jgi:hypothetical protein
MQEPLDIIGRPLKVGDFVVYYNMIYKITALNGRRAAIFLAKPSPTTKKRNITCNELTLLPEEDVIMWFLKRP